MSGRGQESERQRWRAARRYRGGARRAGTPLFERLVATTPDLLFIFDLAARRSVYASRRLGDLLGPSQGGSDEALGGGAALVHPDDQAAAAAFLEGFAAAADGEARETEYRVRHHDGSWRWLRVRAGVYARDEGGRPTQISGVAQDITAQKQTEQSLRASITSYRELADAMPQLVWASDPAGVVNYYNARAADYAGLSRGPEGRWSWAAVVHPDEREATVAAWAAAQTTLTYQHEHRLQMRDGGYRWHLSRAHPLRDEAGRVLVWFGTATDIHERKRAEVLDSFLLRLLDATHRLTAPEAITAVTARLLGEHLGADRCAYAEVEADENRFTIIGDYTSQGTRSIVGHFAMSDFGGEALRLMRAGEPYIVEDSAADARVEDHAAYAATQIAAVISVPLRKNGRFVAGMAVHQRRPRRWTADEVELVRLVANLCWEAIARARSERSLRASEERYRSLLQSTTSLIWTTDAAGLFVEPQPGWEAYTAQPWPEHQGQGWAMMVHPDDRAGIAAAWAAALAEQRTYEGRGRLWHAASRSYRFFVARAAPVRTSEGAVREWVGTVADIHEQKQAEQAAAQAAGRTLRLQHVTAALSAALTPSDVGRVVVEQSVAALGAVLGSVRLLSADAAALHEVYTRGEQEHILAAWRSIPLSARFPITDAVRSGEAIWLESLDAVDERYPDLADLMRSHGYAASASIPLTIDQQVIGGLTLSFAQPRRFSLEDQALLQAVAQQCAQALERTRLYDAERRERAAAEAAVRLRDQFFSVAAHELKTPLTSLLGNAQLLQRRAEREGLLGERERRNVQVIVAQVQRLNRMVLALLDVSRLETGQLAIERAPLDVGELVARLVEEACTGLEGRAIELAAPDAPLVIEGDALRLEQVVQNLLQNAIKYSAAPAPVRVTVSRGPGRALVAVADQGIGVPAANIPQLFQRFYRADNVDPRQFSGMGIGLYVVKEIVTLHGGTVEVESTEGAGSTFTICLPLAPRP